MTRYSETPPAWDRPKVFCLGLNKTGTSSLGLALERLGYRVAGYRPFRDIGHRADLDLETVWARAREILETHDAVQDMPWPLLYDRLDAAYPSARFIHVVRDPDAWLASVKGDFAAVPNEINRIAYGAPYPAGFEREWLAGHARHTEAVRHYFAGREGRDFLSLDLGEIGWAPICGFLGHPVPDTPWPHANTQRIKRRKLFWWRQKARVKQLLGLSAPR